LLAPGALRPADARDHKPPRAVALFEGFIERLL
jgi:hypothetical protein